MEVPEGLELRESAVNGMGVFATRRFPSGHFFGLFHGIEYTLSEFKAKYGKDIRYSYQLGRQNKIICAKEKRNWITYLNESEQPNVVLKKRGAWASREIEAGEELFLFYDKKGVIKYPRDY